MTLSNNVALITTAHGLKCYTCDDPSTCESLLDNLDSTFNQTCDTVQDFCYVNFILIYIGF